MEDAFLLAQILNRGVLLFFFALTPMLTILAWMGPRRRARSPLEKGIWALACMVPIMGPLAFWSVNPQSQV
ncbi:MAG TPA: hypothetical protein EYP25_14385 [Anaerolineae bacterium]|nr:hypothetical protein [Anaerolineae bacterium]